MRSITEYNDSFIHSSKLQCLPFEFIGGKTRGCKNIHDLSMPVLYRDIDVISDYIDEYNSSFSEAASIRVACRFRSLSYMNTYH